MNGRAIAIAAAFCFIAALVWCRAVAPTSAPSAGLGARTAASGTDGSPATVAGPTATQNAGASTPSSPSSAIGSRAVVLDPSQHPGAHRAEHESGEALLTLRWDALPPSTRVRELRRDLDAALADLECSDDAAQRGVAQATLTALRGELFATASGRALHRDYEARLERLTGEAE